MNINVVVKAINATHDCLCLEYRIANIFYIEFFIIKAFYI